MALTKQLLATKNISAEIQRRMDAAPGRQRANVEAATANEKRTGRTTPNAPSIDFKWRPWKLNPQVTSVQIPPSTVVVAFNKYAGELTQLIRKKKIEVLFTNGRHDPDKDMIGFMFQVIPDKRKMSDERYNKIVAVMDKIAAEIRKAGEDVTPISDLISFSKRPIGLGVNVHTSHLDKTVTPR